MSTNNLQFVLSDFWHFLGAVILLGVALDGVANIIRAIRGC